MSGFQIIKNTEQLEARPTFFVFYGLPGVGKTSLSFTMPQPVLHFDFDEGLSRAAQKLRPESIRVEQNGYGQFWSFIQSDKFEAYIEDNGIETIAIDTIGTMLEDYVAPWLISQNPKNGTQAGGLSLSGWGTLSTHFNAFRNRIRSLGVEMVAICHAKEEGDDRQYRLAVKGGSSEIIYRSCDMIGFVSVIGDHREIDFNPSQLHIGKNMAALPKMRIPDYTTDQYDEFGVDLVDRVKQKMVEESNAQAEMKQRVQEYRDWLAECKKPADFDAVIASIADETSKALKAQAKKLLRPALDGAGLEYDAEKKKVVKKQAKAKADQTTEEEAPKEEADA